MATLYSDQLTTISNGGVCKPNAVGGKLRIQYFSFLTTGHVSGDIVELFKLPRNARIIEGEIIPSATVGGTCTVKVGWAADDDAIRAAATLTAAGTMAGTLALNKYTELTSAMEATDTDLVTFILTYAAANPAEVTIRGHVVYVLE